jgi:hypothetical protein
VVLVAGDGPGSTRIRALRGDQALRCPGPLCGRLSARTIGKLAGWSEGAVEELLKVHGDQAAQAEIDALYAAEREGVEA